jgi:hypothetical protein
MKIYKKAEMVAKNAPDGSYAAGCPTNAINDSVDSDCKQCESAKLGVELFWLTGANIRRYEKSFDSPNVLTGYFLLECK